MRLKNYNEDLVLETVKIVLKDRPDIPASRSLVLDVAAYALNRVPPKYITSERGFTREFVHDGNGEEGERLVNVIELITLVNRAVDVVARRRREAVPARRPVTLSLKDEDLHLTYFYNMPHIFGRVVDESSGQPVIDARATLWVNDQVSVPAEPGWHNPITTHEQTKGYFSFWPQVEMGQSETARVDLRVSFEHDGYKPCDVKKSLKVTGDFFVHDYIRGDKLLDLGTLPLSPA